jgi:predicted transposase/invertase (TIGR01784 family)
MPESLNQPHDAFMKALLAEPDLARAFFAELLPPALVASLDFSTLSPLEGSYVSSKLRRLFSDALFRIESRNEQGKSCVLSLLLEHKSSASSDTAIQVLGYLYEGYRAQWSTHKSLHPIIPVVYYHGKDKWSPLPLSSLMKDAPENLGIYIPNFQMVEVNLQAMPEEAVFGLRNVWLRAALQIQKFSHSPRELLDNFVRIFESLNTAREGNFFQQLSIYYFWVSKVEESHLRELILKLPPQQNQRVMKRFESILEVREKRGLEKGIEKGMELGLEKGIEKGLELGQGKGETQARNKAAITGFQNGVPMNIICLMTGYTEQEVLQIVAEENLQKGEEL